MYLGLHEYAQRFGPVYKLCFGPKSFIVISDAQLARMSRAQLAETMRQAQQEHARLHRLTGALLDLQERVARRL